MQKLIHDHVFANMTWLEQAVSGVICPQHDVLLNAPDEIHMSSLGRVFYQTTVHLDQLYDYLRDNFRDIRDAADFLQVRPRDLYKIQVSDDFEYSFITQEVKGDIYLKKNFTPLEDKAIIIAATNTAQEHFSTGRGACPITRARAIEVLDTIDQHESRDVRKHRDTERLVNGALELYANKIRSGTWNIKNTELIASVRKWIISYIIKNDITSMVNLTKLKLSTYSDGPIYSIPQE